MSECQADDHRSLDRKGQHDCSPQNRTQRLNKHMYGIHRPPTPLCSLWVGEQTVERVLQYCAEYGEVRKTCWATETVTCRDLWMPAANFYVTSWLNAPPPTTHSCLSILLFLLYGGGCLPPYRHLVDASFTASPTQYTTSFASLSSPPCNEVTLNHKM